METNESTILDEALLPELPSTISIEELMDENNNNSQKSLDADIILVKSIRNGDVKVKKITPGVVKRNITLADIEVFDSRVRVKRGNK